MKTKIYIVLLLGLFSIKSNAQEQFLKLDSIQVIYGTLNKIMDPNNNQYRTGRDTLNIVTNFNSIIKLKSVLINVEYNYGQCNGSCSASYNLDL